MLKQFERTSLVIGEDNVKKLNESKVVVFGAGGVGSYVIEALARAGVGHLVIVDGDKVDETNINRQIIALHSTIGLPKVEVAKKRVMDINPNIEVQTREEFFLSESEDFFDETIDYVVDAVDTVTAKIEIIERAKKHNIPVISSMGTGNKLDPTRFEIADISKTSVCPLAKVMRKELKERGINKLKVVYSRENPIKHENGRTPGSISFVPSVAGLIIASEVIKDVLKN